MLVVVDDMTFQDHPNNIETGPDHDWRAERSNLGSVGLTELFSMEEHLPYT
jgi:hypothetical protein